MDIYTATNFFKYQHTILETLDKTKQPIEIITIQAKENSANKGYVLMPKEEYQQLTTVQDEQLHQAESDIRRYALTHDPKAPVNNDEMEKWLTED
ncbi:hypothetical protein ACFP1H_09565 [Secundilactobacillus hailunensis]|uniref:Antitoxin n=2 Tax=Secundilactobacillus hailunensis TaxID=2559923 RepID=A0ABW1TBU3_9LACO|nr:hypothetical protein [Secundilactobacillus hailunensis]